MFDSARLPHDLTKEQFDALQTELHEQLLDAQFDLVSSATKSVLVLINGSDGAGKGGALNRLYEWLDPHHLDTISHDEATEEERMRPFAWRYWRDMPARGRIGVMLGSWYHPLLLARALGETRRRDFLQQLGRINDFEAMLAAEGVAVCKIWLQLDHKEARARLKKITRGNGEETRPVVREWADVDTRRERRRLSEAGVAMAEETSKGVAPWFLIPADNKYFADLSVGRCVLATLLAANDAAPSKPATNAVKAKRALAAQKPIPGPTVISALDLGRSVDDKTYDEESRDLKARLTRETSRADFADRGLILVFEGNDAAGKGGAIQRVRQALDPRRFRVLGVAAPTDEERARPYLWRFWRNIPRRGHIGIFDRSWYGRVLVERVEQFCDAGDWMRAYDEINDFERQLSDSDYTLVKFWMAISPEEQMRRFKAREAIPTKRYKITPDDWRNRDKWDLYAQAVNDMVDRTSTSRAPWTLVEAEDKRYARLKVLRTIVETLET